MIGLLVFLILLLTFYDGGRRGTLLQLVYTLGFAISLLYARVFYRALAQKIELLVPYMSVTPDSKMYFYDQATAFELDKAYYAGVAFVMILFVGWLLTRLVGIFASNLRFYNLLGEKDWLVAGVINALIAYMIVFMLLLILSMLPVAGIQNIFEKSWVACTIVDHTPILSGHFQRIWITDMIH